MDMDVRPLVTEADYDWALAEVTRYFDDQPAPGTPDAARLDVLATLIEHYEAKHWLVAAPDPVDAIRACMEWRGSNRADLAELLGSRFQVSELLGRKRPLTLQQVSRLHQKWGMPADGLLRSATRDATSGKRMA